MKKKSNLHFDTSKPVMSEKFKIINLNKIQVDPNQPRKEFDSNSLKELADSISLYGVMAPIMVSETDGEQYIVRQGERRYQASLLAGMKDIPAIIDNDKNNILEKQLVENIVRENLSMVEIANTIKYLVDCKKVKKGDIAKSLTKSNAFVSNYYAFATFDHPLKDSILEKTQDLIIIIELKRLLKTTNNIILKRVEDFINMSKNISRDSLNNLKISLDYYSDSENNNITDYNNNVISTKKSCDDSYNNIVLVNESKAISDNEKYSVKVDLTKILRFLNRILPNTIKEDTINKIKKNLVLNNKKLFIYYL